MPFEFRLPDLGEGIEEAEVLQWQVARGDQVAAFQPLCQVESAKAAVELTAPVAGRIREVCVAQGGVARRGELLVVIDTGGRPSGEWFRSRAAARAEPTSEPTAKSCPRRAVRAQAGEGSRRAAQGRSWVRAAGPRPRQRHFGTVKPDRIPFTGLRKESRSTW
jgi:pyruvate dehydrogenase E2 component (dihydrolipoamide acetyltransferase)